MLLIRAACGLLAAAFLFSMRAADHKPTIVRDSLLTNSFASLDELLEPLREQFDLPALAAAVVTDKQLLAAGVVGLRKMGSPEPALLTDKFHIGSCTKSMTALLAALTVARGQLDWTTTIENSFAGWKFSDDVGSITFEQLLNHRSGLPYTVSKKLWADAFSKFRGTGPEQREEFLKRAFAEGVESRPGKKYIYSNLGYSAAGTMIERKTGDSWEDLVRDEIFKPLHMTSAGFGPPNFPGQIDQPWGHQFDDGKPVPRPRGDNPISIAPAGLVHCSIIDLAQYASFHLAAVSGKIPWIDDTMAKKLYSPPSGAADDKSYAMGWIVVDRPWAGGKALTHAGSNTFFYSLIWVAPGRNIAFVVSTNAGVSPGDKSVTKAADAVIVELIEKFLESKPAP